MTLGRIEEIRYGARAESPLSARGDRMKRMAAPELRQAVPVEAGALQASAEVEVIFAIGQP